jgi:uncharacterized protein YfaQ (DUF2300 family)
MASSAQGAPREHKRKTWDVKTRDRVYQKESYGIPKKNNWRRTILWHGMSSLGEDMTISAAEVQSK